MRDELLKLLPFQLDPTVADVLLIALATAALAVLWGLVVLVIYLVMRPRMKLRRRMEDMGLVQGKGPKRGGLESNTRQRRIQQKLEEIQDKNKERRRANQIRGQIIRAGLEITPKQFLLISMVIGIAVAVLMMLIGLHPVVAFGGLIVGTLGLPRLGLRILARRRQKKFTSYFANAIDIVLRGLRSGLPVGECLNIISREVPDPVGEEFRNIVQGQKMGMNLDELMARALERMPTTEFMFFATVLEIQQQTGGNLADTLANLAHLLRERKKLRDKVRALSSEAKASALIIGVLPFFVMGMVYVINPDYITLLFTETMGQVMLIAGFLWMAMGIFIMTKMINFEI